jgi:hypothetical protein
MLLQERAHKITWGKREKFRYTDFSTYILCEVLCSLIDINGICFKVEMFRLFIYVCPYSQGKSAWQQVYFILFPVDG